MSLSALCRFVDPGALVAGEGSSTMYIFYMAFEVLDCLVHPGAPVVMEHGSTMHSLYVVPETPSGVVVLVTGLAGSWACLPILTSLFLYRGRRSRANVAMG